MRRAQSGRKRGVKNVKSVPNLVFATYASRAEQREAAFDSLRHGHEEHQHETAEIEKLAS